MQTPGWASPLPMLSQLSATPSARLAASQAPSWADGTRARQGYFPCTREFCHAERQAPYWDLPVVLLAIGVCFHNLLIQLVVGVAVDLVVADGVPPVLDHVGGDANDQHPGVRVPHDGHPVENDLAIHQ